MKGEGRRARGGTGHPWTRKNTTCRRSPSTGAPEFENTRELKTEQNAAWALTYVLCAFCTFLFVLNVEYPLRHPAPPPAPLVLLGMIRGAHGIVRQRAVVVRGIDPVMPQGCFVPCRRHAGQRSLQSGQGPAGTDQLSAPPPRAGGRADVRMRMRAGGRAGGSVACQIGSPHFVMLAPFCEQRISMGTSQDLAAGLSLKPRRAQS